MADTAAHVTMLQRSPTYIVPVPSKDRIANTLPKLVGRRRAYAITRRKNIAKQRAIFNKLEALGVDLTDTFDVLEDQGVEKFATSWRYPLEATRDQLDTVTR